MRTVALLFLTTVLIFSVGICLVRGAGYAKQSRDEVRTPASLAHVAGTDDLGRDRGVRLAVAVLLSFGGATLASLLAILLGVTGGVLTAFGPSWTPPLVRYLSDLFHTLPWLFLLMIMRAALPLNTGPWQSASVTFAIFALLGAPVFLRLNHERTTALLDSSWMFHARAMGLTFPQQLRYITPHLRPLFWTQFLLYLPACIISEANLGTMGLGLPEPLPSFGTFLSELQSNVLLGNTWLTFLPVVLLMSVLVALEVFAVGVPSE